MPRAPYRQKVERAYVISMLLRQFFLFSEPDGPDLEELCLLLQIDYAALCAIRDARYLRPRPAVPKSSQLHLAWEYAKDPAHHHRFREMLRVSPVVFDVLVELIRAHPVFQNNSNNPQEPVETQLAVTLYRMGRSASVRDVARVCGISEGTVELYTDRCFTAIDSLHDRFVRELSPEEKEVEKEWIDRHMGFRGLWREGWVMYDGTIVVLHERPAFCGSAYYTRKSNYGLNVQIGNTPSNLRIVDYAIGYTGSAHDSSAFDLTGAARFTDWFFKGEEFAWADSAYALTRRMIPVHKDQAARNPDNAKFDTAVSHLRVRSEHTMGALKGRFPCLRDLRVAINTRDDHTAALRWITIAIIIHNIVIDIEGTAGAEIFIGDHPREAEEADSGNMHDVVADGEGDEQELGEQKRRQLVAELLAHYNHRHH